MKGDNISEHKAKYQYWHNSTVARDHSVFRQPLLSVSRMIEARAATWTPEAASSECRRK
jgi:hypothetical protein